MLINLDDVTAPNLWPNRYIKYVMALVLKSSAVSFTWKLVKANQSLSFRPSGFNQIFIIYVNSLYKFGILMW